MRSVAAVHPRVYGEYDDQNPGMGPSSGSSPRVRGIRQSIFSGDFDTRFIPACTGNTVDCHVQNQRPSVHPRVYGEYSSYLFVTMLCSGSSPRVRGILVDDLDDVRPHRFIPACTGNTRTGTSTAPARSVHPRVYGEYVSGAIFFAPVAGSSPRVRGIHEPEVAHKVDRRFIPACTGNTSGRYSTRPRMAVHPRVYGEYVIQQSLSKSKYGSSPRVRGILNIITVRWAP